MIGTPELALLLGIFGDALPPTLPSAPKRIIRRVSRYVSSPPLRTGKPNRMITDNVTGCRYLLRWPDPTDPCRVEAITIDTAARYGSCQPLPIRKTCR